MTNNWNLPPGVHPSTFDAIEHDFLCEDGECVCDEMARDAIEDAADQAHQQMRDEGW